jgi:hypothetical protein
MNNNLTRLIRISAAIVVISSMQACGDYSVRLPGGYVLSRVYAGAVLINHPEKGIVVDANIDGYRVVGDQVVGHVTAADLPPEKEHSKPGYFFLNTKTHEVRQGLDKKAWLESLESKGIRDEPTLSKPSRFDKDY